MRRTVLHIDWVLVLAVIPLLLAGLSTMHSFVETSNFFTRQLAWVCISFAVFLAASMLDWRFLRRTAVVIGLYIASVLTLLVLFVLGTETLGAISRFDFGAFFVQPSEPIQLVLIIVLAKYLSRRHVEIAHYKHILISGLYALLLFVLLFLQPDFGSAVIIFLVWFGMVFVSGLSKKHLLALVLLGALVGGVLWGALFTDEQRERVLTFLHPLTDLEGAGYNAYQSTVAVGSGQLIGKGLGYGTQSRLEFLPEYETDFIFAAFAEEWGFIGVFLLFVFFGIVLWRIVREVPRGETNFEAFFALGLALLFASHIVVHVGMNIGLLPVTGITIPFLSYGGSHLLTEFFGLGILMGMRKYHRTVHREQLMRSDVPGLR